MAAKKQNNRRGTAKTTSKKKNTRKTNCKRPGSCQWIPDRDYFMDFLCRFNNSYHQQPGYGRNCRRQHQPGFIRDHGTSGLSFPGAAFWMCSVFYIQQKESACIQEASGRTGILDFSVRTGPASDRRLYGGDDIC